MMSYQYKQQFKKMNTYSPQEQAEIDILQSILKIDCNSYSITKKIDDINNIIITFFYKGILYIQLRYNNEVSECKIKNFMPNVSEDKYFKECVNLDSVKNGCNNLFNIILNVKKVKQYNEEYH